jgi:ribosomal protein L11 methyltransferase
MNWQKLRFQVDAKQSDTLCNVLEAFLAASITVENAGEDEFYEVAFPRTPDWETVFVSALFNEEVDASAVVDFIQNSIFSEQEVPVTLEKLVDQDWQQVWLDSFSPFQVGDQLWIVPSWHDPVDESARNLVLDPGLAFGTGTHPTTNMCLNWISENNMAGRDVLDYGCGSGILAIATLLCGANKAIGIDVDPLAVEACRDNAIKNHVSNKLDAYLPKEAPNDNYDLVIANILANVLIEFSAHLTQTTKIGGTILLTGILAQQVEKVKQAFETNFVFSETRSDHWCLLIGERVS